MCAETGPEPTAEVSRESISVCMATYNGAKYITPQIDSILGQLHDEDEIVVVDDASSDATFEILSALDDPRVRVYRNTKNRGYVRTFEKALGLASRDVILLSDQDDIWVDGRADAMATATRRKSIVASNLLLLDSGEPLRSPLTGRPWRLSSGDDGRKSRNQMRILLGDAPYFGCAMALRRDALGLVLPFPPYLTESHDLWIATLGNAADQLTHLDLATVMRRVHDENASSSRPRGVVAALRSRQLLLRLWKEARQRVASARTR
jgi:glycosyltransferase involved in cell wall biosynthesis